MVLEVILVLFVLYYFVQEVIELTNLGTAYFREVWNFIDIVNIILFMIVIGLRLHSLDYLYGVLGVTDQVDPVTATGFPSLYLIANTIVFESYINAVNAMLMWFKIFKYCQVSRRMSFLLRILARASTDIFFFIIMFLIFFLGFAQAAFLLFSVEIRDFRTYSHSIVTLFRGIVGGIEYDELYLANRYLGPLFYILFYLLVLLILTNVFLAILNDAYMAVRAEDKAEGEETGEVSIIKGIKAVFNMLRGKGSDILEVATALKNADGDGDGTSIEELAASLSSIGLSF
jgi:hypothetical protein